MGMQEDQSGEAMTPDPAQPSGSDPAPGASPRPDDIVPGLQPPSGAQPGAGQPGYPPPAGYGQPGYGEPGYGQQPGKKRNHPKNPSHGCTIGSPRRYETRQTTNSFHYSLRKCHAKRAVESCCAALKHRRRTAVPWAAMTVRADRFELGSVVAEGASHSRTSRAAFRPF